jgi:pimeloyl-ACP methyl ester carboxylesterase
LEINSSADFVRMTRAALAAAGFMRKELDGTVYWEAGAGDTMVLIHGANDQAGTWFTVAPALAQMHRVVVPDLAGHGESAPKDGPIPISLIVARLQAVIGDAENITLAGNSLGGWIALLYTFEHPSQIARLVLEDSGGLSRPLAMPLVAHTREEALPILRAVHGPHYQPPDWVIDALVERASGSPMIRLTELPEHDIESRLSEINTPTTLIWGANDGVLPLSYAHALQQAIPKATLQIIEGAAHIPHMQQPERFLQCLAIYHV